MKLKISICVIYVQMKSMSNKRYIVFNIDIFYIIERQCDRRWLVKSKAKRKHTVVV
jgi:hypothetical protein